MMENGVSEAASERSDVFTRRPALQITRLDPIDNQQQLTGTKEGSAGTPKYELSSIGIADAYKTILKAHSDQINAYIKATNVRFFYACCSEDGKATRIEEFGERDVKIFFANKLDVLLVPQLHYKRDACAPSCDHRLQLKHYLLSHMRLKRSPIVPSISATACDFVVYKVNNHSLAN